MISFRKFLNESWKWGKEGVKVSGNFRPGFGAIHNKQIGPHNVEIAFIPNLTQERKHLFNKELKDVFKKGHYEVEYRVDGNLEKNSEISPESQQKIFHHVNKTIHKFIQRFKPKALHFYSKDNTKIRLHVKLAHHLSKKYGGKEMLYSYPESSEEDKGLHSSEVRFNYNKKRNK